jgi:hypothetical protein
VTDVRNRSKRSLLVVLVVLVAAVLAAGGTSRAQDEPDLSAPSLKDYGPTKRAPSGGRPEGRAPGSNRWKYRGTLAKLGNNEQVVPPVADPPVDDPSRAPLTGKKAGSLNRRAVVVKIDNVPPARPQIGINQADIVYEELVEAGFTRLAAVFHSKSPSTIGPVRSARSTDIGIAVSFDYPVFAYSGANSIFDRLIARARLADRGAEITGELYRRSGGRPAPHNLFTSAPRLLNSASKRNGPPPHFEYRGKGESIAPDVATATDIRLRYQRTGGQPVRYEWDTARKGWARWQNNSAHRDVSGVQIAPENVIVQIVPYADAGLTDKFGEDLLEAQLVGTGEALVFTNGHVYPATWTKSTLRSVTTYTDADGNHIKLTRGRTWVSLVPPGGVTFNAYKCSGQIATIAGTNRSDNLRGTNARDVIVGLDGDDTINGRDGNDLICAGRGNDRVSGGPGADRVKGQSGDDDLRGGAGADNIKGGGGSDQLHGDAGPDRLAGNGGADQLFGDENVDNLRVGSTDVVTRGW